MATRNGCWGRKPFEPLIPLPATYTVNLEGHAAVCKAVELIPFVFSRDCEYSKSDLGKADKGCFNEEGEVCKWRVQK